jgi:hypothetical protein
MGVRSLAWHESVETVRPVGKGVLMLSGVSAAAFLYTANCMRLSTPLVQIKVVWSQFAVTTATATVGLALLLKPCWKDPLYCRTQSDLARQDLGKLGWQDYHAKWGRQLQHLPAVNDDVQAWLGDQVKELTFFEFVRRHGVDHLGAVADTLKAKYDPRDADYTKIMGARAELAKLEIEVDPWLASQFGGLENIAALAAQFPTALDDGALSGHLSQVAILVAKQVKQDGWKSCMERYQRYYDILDREGRIIVATEAARDLTTLSVLDYWRKHQSTQGAERTLKGKLLEAVPTLSWAETASLKPLAEALELPWSEVIALLDYPPPPEVKAALEADELAQEDFQAWVLRTTETIDDIVSQFEWGKLYLLRDRDDEMNARVYAHYQDDDSSTLHQGPFQHLVPDDLMEVVEDPLRLTELLTRSNLGMSFISVPRDD